MIWTHEPTQESDHGYVQRTARPGENPLFAVFPSEKFKIMGIIMNFSVLEPCIDK